MAQTVNGRCLGQLTGQVGTAAVGTVPAAHQGVSNHQGDVVGVRPAGTLDGDRNMGQRHVIITYTDLYARAVNKFIVEIELLKVVVNVLKCKYHM